MDNLFIAMESVTLLMIWKLLIILLLGVYMVFAGLMAKQIGSMIRAVTIKDDFVIRILGTGHFVFAVLVFLIAILIL